MAIKTIEYTVDIAGVLPANEQAAGTQGDHRVTKLNFTLSNELYNSIVNTTITGKAMYRFNVYDGEGGVWQSEAKELDAENVSIELEERHTRFGGKIIVYLVITALSLDNETEMELYSFPVMLRLKSRPEGVQKAGENYESVTGLAEIAKQKANEASTSAVAAETANKKAQDFAAVVEEKLKNGEFDGVGVKTAQIVDDELIITYTNGVSQNLGNVKGATGAQGVQGEKGDAGKDAVIDQTYNAESENAQSGVAVAEVLGGYVKKTDYASSNNAGVVKIMNTYGLTCADGRLSGMTISYENYLGRSAGSIVSKGTLDNVLAEKVDAPLGDIETALDSIIAVQNELIGGDSA